MVSHGHAQGGLSPKALRLYERSGLLVPHRVDPCNGYRWYLVEQLGRARRIRLLRRMGMPLSVVSQAMAAGGREAAERVESWWRAQEEALRARRGALEELRLSWSGGDGGGAGAGPVCRVGVESAGAVKVAAMRARTDQQRLVATFHERAERIRGHLRGQGASPTGPLWVLYHGSVTPDGAALIEVAVPFIGHAEPCEGVVIRLEGAHTCAVCRVPRRDCFPARIMGAYAAVERWVQARGAQPCGVFREVCPAGWGTWPRKRCSRWWRGR
ncbi:MULTISPECIES: MerR family transcriptional regulator [unclassified Nocardiopsis]|uniref:MerR family transcriptional regulator n=1 Tax=unclassified Nocardiopsis TaxID=2649073 RepID=UPI001F5B09DF|nr:MerR family transcriptional regulator [Nocardiopsis sp. TSRI0078]